MSHNEVNEWRLDRLEKSDEKKTEILQELSKTIAVMQTKFIIIGLVGSSFVAGAITLLFDILSKWKG